jgi:hypothetical protein
MNECMQQSPKRIYGDLRIKFRKRKRKSLCNAPYAITKK